MVYIKCRDVVAKISDIIDHEASLMTRMRFHGHIMMCNNCRRYFNQFKKVKALAGEVTAGDLPPDFEQVMGAVLDEIEGRKDA